jgi:hypothetical protein
MGAYEEDTPHNRTVALENIILREITIQLTRPTLSPIPHPADSRRPHNHYTPRESNINCGGALASANSTSPVCRHCLIPIVPGIRCLAHQISAHLRR